MSENNPTDYFLRDVGPEDLDARNVRHVIASGMKPAEAVHRSAIGIDILPTKPTLHSVGIELASDPWALLRFPSAIRRLDYDFVVMDRPPALVAELRAAKKVAKSTGTGPDLFAIPSCVTEKEALQGEA